MHLSHWEWQGNVYKLGGIEANDVVWVGEGGTEKNGRRRGGIVMGTLTSVLTNTFQLVQNLEGTQPVAYTGWPVKSEHVKVGLFKRNRDL